MADPPFLLTADQLKILLDAIFGRTDWQGAFRAYHQAMVDGLMNLAQTKAPIDGNWYEGAFAAGVGGAGEAPAPGHAYLWLNTSTTPPVLELRDGTGAVIATAATREWLDLRPRALGSLLEDEQAPAEYDLALGAVRFGNSGAVAWGHFAAWQEGMAWRVRLDCMMSTGEAEGLALEVWYQVFGPEAAVNPVKDRWQASTIYSLGADRMPTSPNGFRYQVTVVGTSGAAEPTWPTTIGATVVDGTVTWTCAGAGMSRLAHGLTPPNAARVCFAVDSASLQLPSGAAAAGDRVHFALVRGADAHSGDLIVNELRIAPVEV